MSTIREDGSTIPSGVTPGSPGGTLHSGGGDITSGFGPTSGGTARGGSPDITSGMPGAAPVSASISLKPGDPLVINTVTYQYEGVITKSTGEAEIFLLSQNSVKCVFKLYYPNFKPKEDIVKKLKQLKHEDIINVLDYGYYQDRFFEIMEYAAGGTLEKHLPINDIVRIKQIVSETVNAYRFCHENGIIHKDIKPQNIYYRNADGTDIIIGDFGISTILETGMTRNLTSQSLTVGYAAPEMYGIGGKAYVGKEVDYYALGITIIHVWKGKSPFDGLGIHAISNLTTSGRVHIPEKMPEEITKLVKGLITVDYSKRWGYNEIERWLKGEDVPVHFQVTELSWPPYQFGPNEAAATAEELAALLRKYPDRGQKQLYRKKISAWVELFNQGLSSDLDTIVEDDYPDDQDAGVQKAVYLLDPDQGFVSRGRECRSTDELADALEAYENLFMMELTSHNHAFYLFLEAHDAQKEADTFRKYFSTFSQKKALNTIILELRGRDSFKLGNESFSAPEELLRYEDQQYLVAELEDTESRLSLWIEGSKFPEIKKQVEMWRSLDWHDEVTLAYALGQKSARRLSGETLKMINDNYIIPGDLNDALQSEDAGIFFSAVEQFLQLQNTNKFIEKRMYTAFLDDSIIPKELDRGVNAADVSQYVTASDTLNDLRSRNLLISKKEYQAYKKKYALPKSIHQGFSSDKTVEYTNAIELFSKLQKKGGLETKRSVNTIRSIFLAILTAALLPIGLVFHTERKIEQAIVAVHSAIETKEWDKVLTIISDIQKQMFFEYRKKLLWTTISDNIIGYEENKSDFDLLMAASEAYYRKGVAEYSAKNWIEATVNFKEMKNIEELYLKRFPLPRGASRSSNHPKLKDYLKKRKKYQEAEGLKKDFYDIGPLLHKSLFNAGKEEYEKKHWAEAAKFFDQAPSYENSKIVRKNRYRLAIEKFKSGKLKTAYNLFYKLQKKNSAAKKKMVEILVEKRKKILFLFKGSPSSFGPGISRKTKMFLRHLRIDKVRGSKISLTCNFQVINNTDKKVTVFKPTKVTLSTRKKNYRAVYKKNGFFTKANSLYNPGKSFSVTFSNISLPKNGQRFTFRYGEFYTIYFRFEFPKKI